MSQHSVSASSFGWFRYTSPADMPRERVDEFFEQAIDVSASEEEAFLDYLAGRGISLFVNLQLRDVMMVCGDADSGSGFRLTPDEMVEVCKAFWAMLDNAMPAVVNLSRPGRCSGCIPLSSLIQKLTRSGEHLAARTLQSLPECRVRWTLYGTSLTVEVAS